MTFTVHCSLSVVTHTPFHASVLRPASQAGPMHEAAGVGKLVNVFWSKKWRFAWL